MKDSEFKTISINNNHDEKTVTDKTLLDQLIETLPTLPDKHAPGIPIYDLLRNLSRQEVQKYFSSSKAVPQQFGPFGNVIFPFHSMGAINSIDLFGIDELIIFSYYWSSRKHYQHVVDIGANIGLHSIVLSRCGFSVRAYEPDPIHFALLKQNLDTNNCTNVDVHQAAISKIDGEAEFVRVLGNTTGSHLAGAKDNPYGALERFSVRVESIKPQMQWADLIKIDAEGHEYEILSATEPHDWSRCDAIIEVGNVSNAAKIFELFKKYGVNLFSQKCNWQRVTELNHMPTSYHDGSLFISSKSSMPW